MVRSIGHRDPVMLKDRHAYHCFMAANKDVLVTERLRLVEVEPPSAEQHDLHEYVAQFRLS